MTTQPMPELVREGLAYFERVGDVGDRAYVDAIRQHIEALELATLYLGGLAQRIEAKLPTIRTSTGNTLFDAGTNDACDRIAALLPIRESH
jgi:hypothetical protein